jgi:hypothetical protein
MRKQSIIVRCDGNGCKEIGEVADLNETPSGWYRVFPVGDKLRIQNEAVFDFHSLRCIERWAKARRELLLPAPRLLVETVENEVAEVLAAPAPVVTPPTTVGSVTVKIGNGKARTNTVEEAVELLLEEQGTFLSRDVQTLSGIGQSTVDGRLRKLVDAGTLEFDTIKRERANGNPFNVRRFRAAETAP